MARKSQYVTKLNSRDIQSFRLLYFAHHIPRQLMRASDSRLRAYEKQGLVERCVSIGTSEAIYKCTDKGRAFIGKLDGFAGHKPYINANSSEHNALLAHTIANLPQEQQEQWCSERDLWDMLIRSALRMEQYRTMGFTKFSEIRNFGRFGNNLSANVNEELLKRYDINLNKKGILIENLTSAESVSILYKLKSQNVFIDCIRVNGRTIRPFISIYNINTDKPKKMANRISYAYTEISSLFTDYIADVSVIPTITVHEFGDMKMFNALVYQDILDNHYQEFGIYDLELLQEKVIFNVYENKSKTP